jgi:hypothetical protein
VKGAPVKAWDIAKLISRGRPALCNIAITNSCNATCDFCNFALGRVPQPRLRWIDQEQPPRSLDILHSRAESRNACSLAAQRSKASLAASDFSKVLPIPSPPVAPATPGRGEGSRAAAQAAISDFPGPRAMRQPAPLTGRTASRNPDSFLSSGRLPYGPKTR